VTTYSNPGAIGDVPPSPNKVESTWGNAMRDRVVQNFATETDRDAAITAPVVGMFCYCHDVDQLQQYAGATMGWTPPWNMPWGEVAATSFTSSSQTGFTGDITGLAVTFTAVANRIYIVEATCELLPSASTVGVIALLVQEGGTILKRTQQPSGSYASPIGIDLTVRRRMVGVAAGSHTYKASCSISGTGTLDVDVSSTNPASIRVWDDGANGSPS